MAEFACLVGHGACRSRILYMIAIKMLAKVGIYKSKGDVELCLFV
jgi:hypothetical protein